MKALTNLPSTSSRSSGERALMEVLAPFPAISAEGIPPGDLDLDVGEPCTTKQVLVGFLLQRSGDTSGPGFHILTEHLPLVRREVDDAVGDHHVHTLGRERDVLDDP